MKRVMRMMTGCVLLLAGTAWAGDFMVYPGAELDGKLTREAMDMSAGAPGGNMWNVAIYTTRDPFEEICTFYAKIGNEYRMPSGPESMKLPSGTEIHTKYYLFGEAVDLLDARSWIKIQNPLISHDAAIMMQPGLGDEDIGVDREVTTIMHMMKK